MEKEKFADLRLGENWKEFKVNELITVKLNWGKTQVYVGDQFISQCMGLMLVNPHESEYQDEIGSIDEAERKLGNPFKVKPIELGITPEEEFWGHCSNLQAWAEYDYDTRLLHSNLAFPILKELAKQGDSRGSFKFKEEILKRLESGYAPVMFFLIEEGYGEYLGHKLLYRAVLEEAEAEALLDLERATGEKFEVQPSLNQEWGYHSVMLGYEDKSEKMTVIELEVTQCESPQESFGQFTNLESAGLLGPKLTELPESFGNLKKLKTLGIEGKLTELPESFGKLEGLEELY